jgi:hypothetical protein
MVSKLLFVTHQNHGSMNDWQAMIKKLVDQQHLTTTIISGTFISELNAKKVVKVMKTQIIYHTIPPPLTPHKPYPSTPG